MLMNLGGIKVVVPSTPADAKGLLKAAIRDDNPVVFLQPARRGGEQGEVPDGEHLVELGQGGREARRQRRHAGGDRRDGAPCVARGRACTARKGISRRGHRSTHAVSAGPRHRSCARLRKTGRLVVVDEARTTCSAASEIAALAAEYAFDSLKAPVRRVTVPDVAIPYAPALEKAVLPDENDVLRALRQVMRREVAA